MTDNTDRLFTPVDTLPGQTALPTDTPAQLAVDHETTTPEAAASFARYHDAVGGRRVAGGFIDEFDVPSRDEL